MVVIRHNGGRRSPMSLAAGLKAQAVIAFAAALSGCATDHSDKPAVAVNSTATSSIAVGQINSGISPTQQAGVGTGAIGPQLAAPFPAAAAPAAISAPSAAPIRLAGYAEPAVKPAVAPPAEPPPIPPPPTAPGPNNQPANSQPAGVPSSEPMPIDLPTALRLVDASNPTVALARARVQEAYLRERGAELAWLPDLQAGATYNRHDGRDQQSNGTIFEVSKQNLFVGGGAILDWKTSEILFGRLTAQRLTEAAQASARAVGSDVQLNVALAYLDLLQAYGEYAIFIDALGRAEEMLRNAESADQAGLSKTTADINRARTEVDLRRQRLYELQAQIAIASARLARLLMLRPTVVLKPVDTRIVPVGLIPDFSRLDELVSVGLSTRPEVLENRALIAAAATRLRQSAVGPFIPNLDLTYRGGTFGGGPNSQMDDFGARSDGTAAAIWELRNFGAGDIIQNRIRRTQLEEANINLADVQAQVAEEVTAAARSLQGTQPALPFAQQAVVQALETWRRLREASFGLAGAEHQYDPLQPLIALRDLADARRQYLQTVTDYNRAQFRLYWAMGQPPLGALPKLPPQPTTTPVVPGPYAPKAEEVPPPPRLGP